MGQARSNEEAQRLEAILVNCSEDGPLQPAGVYQELIEYLFEEQRYREASDLTELALERYPFASDFYYSKAKLQILDQQLQAARRTVDRALNIHPGDLEFQLLRSEIFIRLGQISRGLALLAPLKLSASKQDLSDLLVVESLAYERTADVAHMFFALKAALEANPANEQALDRLYACARISKRLDETKQVIEGVLELNPYAEKAWFYLGQLHAWSGHNQQAIQALEYAFLIQPDFEEAYDSFAELCFEERAYREAYQALEEMTIRFGQDSDLYLRQAHCCYQLEQYETARRLLEDAARIDPHNDEVFFQIGECYAAQEKWGRAIPFYRKAIRMNASSEDYYRALAESAFEQGDYTLAETAYRQALDISPEAAHCWLELAWFLMDMLRPVEAREVLAEANETTIDSELTFAYIAALFSCGQRQEALTRLVKALEEDYLYHPFLFEWLPTLRSDRQVNAMLQLYRPEV